MKILSLITAFILILVIVAVNSVVTARNTVKDAPTGGTITVSPSYFYKATQHLKSSFDQAVVDSFGVAGLQGPLPSLNPCIISYDALTLASFTETNITYAAVPSTSSSASAATHQIIISNPKFTLESFPYTASCVFSSGVGQLTTEASGTISGVWAADSITVEVTETITSNTSANQGAVIASAATITTTVGMQLAYTYNNVAGTTGFVFDKFWQHHVQTILQDAVNAKITSLFNQGGAPIAILVNNLNSLFTQWPQVCGIDQQTIPGTLILNTRPLCHTVVIPELPVQDLCVVQVSAGARAFSEQSAATPATCQSETCWSPTIYPNDGNIIVTYSDCMQCNVNQAQITGTSGVVTFSGN